MTLNSKPETLKVPNGTKLFSDGHPRLTMGGFVGSAKINPRYALKVKNEDVYVDFRDFLPHVATTGNNRKRLAQNMTRALRRADFSRRMAQKANVPSGESVLRTPNAILNGQVAEVHNHLITTLDPTFADVEPKILSGLVVQVVDAVTVDGYTTYHTYEVDPRGCSLIGFDASPEKNWIEQNNVYLSIPLEVALAALPESRRAEYENYKDQLPNGGLVVPISGNDILAPFNRGFTPAHIVPGPDWDPTRGLFGVTPITSCVVSMTNPFAANSEKAPRKFYIVDDLSDLMAAIQDPRATNGFFDSFMKVIGPIAQTVVEVVDELIDDQRITRNGYALRDMENVKICRNFTDVCRDCGFEDISSMFEAMSKPESNFIDLIFDCVSTLVDVVSDLFDDDVAAKSGEKKVLADGEVDYSEGGYPFAPGEVTVVSRSTSGIGASGTLGRVTAFPPNAEGGSDPREEQYPPIPSSGTFSIGNSIPRYLEWELDPYFEQTGGTLENVGIFPQYSEFDFSRIRLFLSDSTGLRVPCITDVVSVHNFDSTRIGKGVAILEFAGQGSTNLTVSFPYTIVDVPIRTCLTRVVPRTIIAGSEIDKDWVVNNVSDSEIGGSDEYKNISTLTSEGFEIDPVDTSTPGWKDIVVRPKNTEHPIEAIARVNVIAPRIEEIMEYRDQYELMAYLSPEQAPNPGLVITPADIEVRISYKGSNLPVFFGTAAALMDSGLITSITLNGSPELKLEAGQNVFVMHSRVGDEEIIVGQFTEKIVREVAEISFVPRPLSINTRCHAAADVISGLGITTDLFACTLLYADGGSRVVENDEYALNVIYPPTFTEDNVIAEVKIRPMDISGYDQTVFSGRLPSVVLYASENTKYTAAYGTIRDAEYKPNRLPWIGEFPNPADFAVTVEWGGTDSSKVAHTLDPSSYVVRAFVSATATESPVYTEATDSAIIYWGDQTCTIPVEIARSDETPVVLDRIEAVPRKGQDLTVPYGTRLAPTHFTVTAVDTTGAFRKDLGRDVHIREYFPLFAGTQNVRVVYGTGAPEKSVSVPISVEDPEIVSLVVTPVTTQFDMGDAIGPSDIGVTAVTAEGVTIEIPTSQVRTAVFDTGFIGNQTFMGTIECVGFDESVVTGSTTTASFRFDVGLGGDDASFTTPALVCKFAKPYCFVGDKVEALADLGFDGAFVIASDGTRHAVEDPEHLQLGEVSTEKAGSVIVGVVYSPEE